MYITENVFILMKKHISCQKILIKYLLENGNLYDDIYTI